MLDERQACFLIIRFSDTESSGCVSTDSPPRGRPGKRKRQPKLLRRPPEKVAKSAARGPTDRVMRRERSTLTGFSVLAINSMMLG